VARKRKNRPLPLQPTLDAFLSIWNESLKWELVRLTEETLSERFGKEKLRVDYILPRRRWVDTYLVVEPQIKVWYVSSSTNPNLPVSFLTCVVWEVSAWEEKGQLSSIFLRIRVENEVLGGKGILVRQHRLWDLERVFGNTWGFKKKEIRDALKAGKGEFERKFLEVARTILTTANAHLLPKALDYPHNWWILVVQHLEKYSGAKIDEGVYLKILPYNFDRKHVTHWRNEEDIQFLAVVRAPLFTIAFHSYIGKSHGKEPSEDMSLELKHRVKVGVDTPFVNPSSLHAPFGEVTCAYIFSGTENLPVQQIKLDSPLSLVSTLEQALLYSFQPYVQGAKEASKELGAPTKKARVMRVYVLFFAFVAVVSALLRHAGFDFTITMQSPASHFFHQPDEGFIFAIGGPQSFLFNCTKKHPYREVTFVLREDIDIYADGIKWYRREPLEVSFRLEGLDTPDVVKVSFSADETENITESLEENLAIVRSYLLEFARQVRDYLQKVEYSMEG